MKFLICCCLLLGVGAIAEERVKRQATYTFPGPRSERAYRPQGGAPIYVEEQDEGEVYPASRRQYQPQPQPQPQYAPQPQHRTQAAPQAAPPAPAYEAPRPAAPAPRSQPANRRRAASSSASSRANKYGSAPQQSLAGGGADEEEEEDQGPDALTLLLQDSQFSCGGKQDGYYADDSVNCQVFHYCVGGAKHSWMCPENTVFHQVHLNCVPDAQDICSQSQKFHFVNEYLYKPVDYEGPNNTARYSQRYYPDGYVVGDPLVAPQEHRRPSAPAPQPQHYAQPASAPRSQPRQVAPSPPRQPEYRPQPQPQSAPAYRPAAPQARPQPRPQPQPRPVEAYSGEVPESYRPSAPAQTRPAPAPQAYRPEQPSHQALPPQQVYRSVPAQQVSAQAYRPQPAPQSAPSYSSEESPYQTQARRAPAPVAPQRSAAAGYTQARQVPPQYRANARSGTGYQPYAPSQASGVQYDEDY